METLVLLSYYLVGVGSDDGQVTTLPGTVATYLTITTALTTLPTVTSTELQLTEAGVSRNTRSRSLRNVAAMPDLSPNIMVVFDLFLRTSAFTTTRQ